MANEDVKRAIGEMERNISDIEREIQELLARLNAIESEAVRSTNTINYTIENVNNTMNKDYNDLEYSEKTFQNVIKMKSQIRELLFIFEEVQTAGKKVRMLGNKLYFEFKNQARVRKIARAFIDNLELDMVTDEVIYKSIEKEHLQAPDFWLTFAMLAIMAWKKDDYTTCMKAIDGALSCNEKATIIFMVLFHIRLKRFSVALKWFNCLSGLETLGSDADTLLMFLSLIPFKIDEQDAEIDEFSGVLLNYIKEKLHEEENEEKEANYRAFIMSYFQKLDVAETLQYPVLTRYVSNYQDMANALSQAKNNESILSYFEEVSHVHIHEKNPLLLKYFDSLYSIPSKGEKEIYDEIHDLEDIIAALPEIKKDLGNITAHDFHEYAIHRGDRQKQHDQAKLELKQEFMNWLYFEPDPDVNSLTYWNMFCLISDTVTKAYSQYYYAYHNINPTSFQVDIDDFSMQTDFKHIEKDKQT
ncbi:MAG: hypothetical protein K5762_07375, partial [Bacilli bacterium]|nr:hypothetical protein [Bacilli bacterium]